MMERHFFRSRATQTETSKPLFRVIPLSTDLLPIEVRLFKLCASFIGDAQNFTYLSTNLLTETKIMVPFSRVKVSYRIKRGYVKIIAGYLSKMGVPEDEHPAIVGNIFEAVEVAAPQLPITVVIADVCVISPDVTLLGALDEHQVMIDEVKWETMETYRADSVDKYYRAFMQGVEKVRTDSLEAAVTQTPCFICKKNLYQEELEWNVHQTKLARLRCSHLFHGYCVIGWGIVCDHLCPLCQHPIVDEPPGHFESKWRMLRNSWMRDRSDSEEIMKIKSKLKKPNADRSWLVEKLLWPRD